MKAILITIAALGGLLVVAVWFSVTGWNDIGAVSDTPISAHGYIAMALGIVLSLVVGGGLMALLFYSARNGHDDVDHEL